MEILNAKERELVAIGAAIASNCQPCMEFHIPAARKAGLSDEQILLAIQIADSIKHVPADMVHNFSLKLLGLEEEEDCNDPDCACHQDEEGKPDSPCCP